jgi:hypothetical protein
LKVVKQSVKKGEKLGNTSMKDRAGLAMGYLYRFGPFEIDPQKRTLSCNDTPIPHREGLRRPAFPGTKPQPFDYKGRIAPSGLGGHLRRRGEPEAVHFALA